jgi:site-specific DNA recombinase
LTPSTKERLEALEKQKEDLKISILQAELQKPKYTKEQIVRWISQFKYGDADSIEYRKRIIDTFVNAVFLFDDKLVITYNFKGGTETITLKDIEAAYGSDLKAVSPPNRKQPLRYTAGVAFLSESSTAVIRL